MKNRQKGSGLVGFLLLAGLLACLLSMLPTFTPPVTQRVPTKEQLEAKVRENKAEEIREQMMFLPTEAVYLEYQRFHGREATEEHYGLTLAERSAQSRELEKQYRDLTQ